MKLTFALVFIFLVSFIVQYCFLSPLTISNLTDIKNTLDKAYIATIVGLFMVAAEVFIHDFKYKVVSLNIYISIVILLFIFIYFYRNQIGITEKQYLDSIIESKSNETFISKKILKNSYNFNVIKIAKDTIENNKNDIWLIKQLQKKL